MNNLEINGAGQSHGFREVGIRIPGCAVGRRDVRVNHETRRCDLSDFSRLYQRCQPFRERDMRLVSVCFSIGRFFQCPIGRFFRLKQLD